MTPTAGSRRRGSEPRCAGSSRAISSLLPTVFATSQGRALVLQSRRELGQGPMGWGSAPLGHQQSEAPPGSRHIVAHVLPIDVEQGALA